MGQGPISQTICPSQLKCDGNFYPHPNSDKVIATKLYTWHDMSAVVFCAKFCLPLQVIVYMTCYCLSPLQIIFYMTYYWVVAAVRADVKWYSEPGNKLKYIHVYTYNHILQNLCYYICSQATVTYLLTSYYQPWAVFLYTSSHGWCWITSRGLFYQRIAKAALLIWHG